MSCRDFLNKFNITKGENKLSCFIDYTKPIYYVIIIMIIHHVVII